MESKIDKNNEYIFNSPNYVHIMIEYLGKVTGDKKNEEGVFITFINNEYAIASIKLDILRANNKLDESNQDINYIRGIITSYIDSSEFKVIYVLPSQLYTLQEISAIEAAQVNLLEANPQLNLNGDGVIIGIIDTGIDYLNEEFMDSDGKSRVLYIWDQTINSDSNNNYEVPFGTLYTNEQINKAIEIYNSGGNPYDVVPSKDNYGHGTGMAGIVGATGKNKEIKGIAPECKFVIVKLSEAKYTQESLGVDMPIFS